MENTREKKKILGFELWELLAYFIIYSICGFFIETIFALVRYGVLESRKSFLYGPFCSIYGLGAVIMILFLQFFKKNRLTLFVGGFIIGSITEYLASLIGELILHVKWWDYSNMPLNINGRICLYYSFFWGILAIFLMRVVHPRIEKFTRLLVNKLSLKRLITVTWIITIFIIFDCLLSAYAINCFIVRMVVQNDLNVLNKDIMIELNNKFSENKLSSRLINTLFNNKKMVITYPNLKIQQLDGSMVYMKDLLPEIQPYYYRFQEHDFYK